MRELEDWIGVDLDGTLAEWDRWVRWNHIGRPIPKMVERVKAFIAAGTKVKIFTARVCFSRDKCKVSGEVFTRRQMKLVIRNWTRLHVGTGLDSTAQKDFAMLEYWDDKAIQVIANTGNTIADEYEAQIEALKGKPENPSRRDVPLVSR